MGGKAIMKIGLWLVMMLVLCGSVGYAADADGDASFSGAFRGMFVAQPKNSTNERILAEAEIDEVEAAGIPRSFKDFDPVEQRIIVLMLLLILILLLGLGYLLQSSVL
jgi:hypothetical protein